MKTHKATNTMFIIAPPKTSKLCITHPRLEEEGGREEAEAGPQPPRAVHAAPSVRAGAEVPPDALLEQRGRSRAVGGSQPHGNQGRSMFITKGLKENSLAPIT